MEVCVAVAIVLRHHQFCFPLDEEDVGDGYLSLLRHTLLLGKEWEILGETRVFNSF